MCFRDIHVDTPDKHGYSPLMSVSQKGILELVKYRACVYLIYMYTLLHYVRDLAEIDCKNQLCIEIYMSKRLYNRELALKSDYA